MFCAQCSINIRNPLQSNVRITKGTEGEAERRSLHGISPSEPPWVPFVNRLSI